MKEATEAWAPPRHLLLAQQHSSRRYLVLLAFCLSSITNGFTWLMFEPIVHAVIDAYGGRIDATTVALLGTWQPFMYLVLCFPMTSVLVQPNGLKRCLQFASVCELVGMTLKFLSLSSFALGSSYGLYALHLGQILSAVSSPVAIGAPSQMSAEWFVPRQRTRSTAAAVLSNNVGNAVVYLVCPALVSWTAHHLGSEGDGVKLLFALEAVLAVVTTGLCFSVFPHYSVDELSPIASPSASKYSCFEGMSPISSAEAEVADFGGPSVWDQIVALLHCRWNALLFIVYAWTSGAFIAWTALFDHLLVSLGFDFSTEFIGFLSFASTVGYITGGLVAGAVADMYFPRHMKHIIAVMCACNAVVVIFYCRAIPTGSDALMHFGGRHPSRAIIPRSLHLHHHPVPVPEPAPHSAVQPERWYLLLLSFTGGLFNGASAPLFYEVLAETTYPLVSESVSGNVLSLMENVGALFMFQVVARLVPDASINQTFALGMVACTVTAFFMRVKYKRREAHEAVHAEELARCEEVPLGVNNDRIPSYGSVAEVDA